MDHKSNKIWGVFNNSQCKIKEKRGFLVGKKKNDYCLSRLSIFRDLCSILVIMASALSASTNPSFDAFVSVSVCVCVYDFLTSGKTFSRESDSF